MTEARNEPNLDNYLSILRAVAGELDFDSVLSKIAGEIQVLLPHDHLDVTIILPTEPDLHVAYEVGTTTSWGEYGAPQPIAASPIRALLAGEVPFILTDDAWVNPVFHFEGAFSSPIFDANLRSRIHVPLKVHGTICGSINVSSHAIGAFQESDVDTMKNIADLLAPYFYALNRGQEAEKSALAEGAARGRAEALRIGALRLTEGMESERRRLGMELHDQTLAELTRMHRQIDRLSRNLHVSGRDLLHLRDASEQCAHELRRIIEDAKPGILELFGFMQAVETQLERSVAGARKPIKTSVTDHTNGLLDGGSQAVRTAVFRIVQEALNNAVEHGRCTSIDVDISTSDDTLQIAVEDNGFGAGAGWDRSTRGIENMRVRADLISATLQLESQRDKQMTRVTIRIPISELTAELAGSALSEYPRASSQSPHVSRPQMDAKT